MGIDEEKKRISLGLKQVDGDPWDKAEEKYKPGQVLTAKVTRLAEFGAFVELEKNIEGLIHKTEIAHSVPKKVEDVLKPADEVTIKVLAVDMGKRRISLSIKALIVKAGKEAEAETVDHEGMVIRKTGAFQNAEKVPQKSQRRRGFRRRRILKKLVVCQPGPSLKFNKFLWVVLLFLPCLTLAANGVRGCPYSFEQGNAFLRAQTYQLALDRFYLAGELSRDDAERAEALRWTGEAYLRDKHYDLAYHDFLTALRLDPLSSNASSAEFKSAIALVYAKNYTVSLEHLSHLEKNDKDIESLSDIYFWEAECYYQTGKYKEALKLYETILRQNPKYRHTFLVSYLVDWCYFQQKDFDNAYEGFSALASKTGESQLEKIGRVSGCRMPVLAGEI